MCTVKNSKYGWFISHENLIKNIYCDVDDSHTSYQLKPELFKILSPYKSHKNSKRKIDKSPDDGFTQEVKHVEELFSLLCEEIHLNRKIDLEVRNEEAVEAANSIYAESGRNLITNVYGYNPDGAITKTLENNRFLFPKNCKFYGKDVSELSQHLNGEKYDLILLDPPWWNKYIRRKRKHSDDGYDMMYNEELKNLPLENHLKTDGLVVVWCTNSCQHLSALRDEIFPKWGISFLGKWYWVKITQSGEPICQFSEPPRKQPFEQIIFGCKETRDVVPNPPCDKLVVSVPSSLHSHKPPLMSLLDRFLPDNPACLELFARYLLPNWTSYGKEVLRFQHESLYTKVNKIY